MSRFAKVCLRAFGVLLMVTGPAFGQSFLGSINGTVKDSTGAVMPEANLTLTQVKTGGQICSVVLVRPSDGRS